MREVTFDEALTKAEEACAAHIGEAIGVRAFVGANPGSPDCAVFDVGCLCTGDHAAFRADAYHFRARLDLFCRRRDGLQRMVMRLLAAFPVNADIAADSPLRQSSNVLVLRVAPEANAVTAASVTEVQARKDASPVPTYSCSASLDVVFRARF